VTGFLVEVYTPAAATLVEIQERARKAATELSEAGAPARYVRSIVVPGDETCFHLFEASSVETVREAARRAGISPQRIVEAEETHG
jgi:hypothetical protein